MEVVPLSEVTVFHSLGACMPHLFAIRESADSAVCVLNGNIIRNRNVCVSISVTHFIHYHLKLFPLIDHLPYAAFSR